MFRRHATAETSAEVTVTVDGKPVTARAGDSVAAVLLLAATEPYRRTVLSNEARAPLCMMGVCFECLVEVDGVGNRQGCLTTVRPGMRIVRQLGLRDVGGLTA